MGMVQEINDNAVLYGLWVRGSLLASMPSSFGRQKNQSRREATNGLHRRRKEPNAGCKTAITNKTREKFIN